MKPQNTRNECFSERSATMVCPKAADGHLDDEITCGVPQGSVVGPTLWNLTYGRVLRTDCLECTCIIGFADNALVMAWGEVTEVVEERANGALEAVASQIRILDLILAVEK